MSERRTQLKPRRKRDRGPDWITEHHEHCLIYEPCGILCECKCYHTVEGYSTNLPRKGPCCNLAKKSFDGDCEWHCTVHGES